MNNVLQNSIAQLPTNEQLELAQWILGSIKAQIEYSSIADLTPIELRQALHRATNNPRDGKTPEQLFEALRTNRESRNA